MRTSELAERAGVNTQTLRYYERRGLLARPPRSASGYRNYPASAEQLVRFVKRVQELGFSLDEAAQLVQLAAGGPRACASARALATARIGEIERRPRIELAALMAYEGQIAGVGDRPPGRRLRGAAIRAMQRRSAAELARRRAAIAAAVGEVAKLEIVNGGGTGSLELTAAEDAVTEVAAGSGFYAPALFDHYSRFSLTPAAGFALPIVRKPAPSVATALGGGYLASGSGDAARLPTPWLPPGLRLDPEEGAGEVQTPLGGPPAAELQIGDRVYFRHAKAGEMCERFDSLYLVEGGEVVDEVPTYRGEGKAFL